MLQRVTSCTRFDDTMAFERNFSVSLRYCLLIALLILIIHALSSDYGVNGEDPRDNGPPNAGKLGERGVTGVKDPGTKKLVNRTQKGKKPKSDSSLSRPDSVNIKPAVEAPKQVPSQSKDSPEQISSPVEKDAKNKRLMGATGTPEAKQAVDKSSIEGTDEEDDPANTDDKDTSAKKPPKTGDESQAPGLSEITYDGEDEEQDSEAEIQLNPSGNVFAEGVKKQPQLSKTSDNVSSAGSFMTYFVIVAIAVIILYLILHNKKKLMAYIVEGRNTSRGRRQRATSGTEYKPLKNADEAPGGRPEEA